MEGKKVENMKQDVKDPIIIINGYLLKSELTTRIAMLLFFGWLISINLSSEADSLDELYRKLALGTATIGVLWILFSKIKMLIMLIKNQLYIKIYEDRIIYEYLTEKGEYKADVLKMEEIVSIKWSFFPYAIRDTEIWITEIKNKDDRRWVYLFSPFYAVISIFYLCIFIFLNKLKIKKYLLYRFKNGVIAVPNCKIIVKDKVDFEWRSLINRYILQGGHYAN
jgi:hypothetical protein